MSLDYGREVVLVRRPRFSGVIDRRSLIVALVLAGVIVAIGLVSLSVGTYQLGLGETAGALLGLGDEQVRMLVIGWRLPRLLFAITMGVALALSGAIFQSITRNPLGSPDVIGFEAGSYAGALVVILVAGSGMFVAVALGSIAGGLATALLIYLLAYRGGVQGFRLIIVGIGVGAMLSALCSYLIMRSTTEVGMIAAAWGAGSLSALGFEQLLPFVVVLAVLVLALATLRGSLGQLELGDDAARALGVRAERTRLLAVIVGVGLIAIVTAAAGPISFIALVAPQIAFRLTRASGLGLVVAALTGAALLTAADFIAARIAVPTGLVTISLGGLYFIWILVRESRT